MSSNAKSAGAVLLSLDISPASTIENNKGIPANDANIETDAKVAESNESDRKQTDTIYSTLPARLGNLKVNPANTDTYYIGRNIPGFAIIFNNENFHWTTGE